MGEIRLTYGKVLIIISKYYKDISENLLKSALTLLKDKSIFFEIIEVPGALEIPQAINFYVKISKIKVLFMKEVLL